MTTAQFLERAWHWDWFGIAVCAAVTGVGGWLYVRNRGRWNVACLAVAVLLLIMALLSPIRVLADHYLFSAHMFQHLLLLLIVPAMLLLSVQLGKGTQNAETQSARRTPESFLCEPPRPQRLRVVLSWLAGVGAMWFWHARPLCEAATTSTGVFRLQVVSLLVAGTIFWWPIFGPNPARQLAPLTGIAYLFSACLGCTLLGIYLTFTPISVCPIYSHPEDTLGALSLIRNGWGMTHSADQSLGGLMMWVPSCMIYLSGIFALFARWHGAGKINAPQSGFRPTAPLRNQV